MVERIVVSTERLVFLRKIISRLVEIICAHIIIIINNNNKIIIKKKLTQELDRHLFRRSSRRILR